jgi:hypothetical protein
VAVSLLSATLRVSALFLLFAGPLAQHDAVVLFVALPITTKSLLIEDRLGKRRLLRKLASEAAAVAVQVDAPFLNENDELGTRKIGYCEGIAT